MRKSTENTALTVVERAAVALGSSKLQGELATLAKKSVDIVEIKNAAGREQCHSAMMALANTRTAITKTGKAARDDANAFSKAVIAEEKRLIDLIEPEEVRLRKLRDGWDEAREAEKRAKAEAEARRIAVIREQIDDIKMPAARLVGHCSFAIAAEIEALEVRDISLNRFQELTGEAEAARGSTLDKLRELHAAAVAHEAEQARLAAEREELARLRAEAAKREEEAAVARAAEEKRLADERAVQEAELRAKREAQERELAAERVEADRLARERLAVEEAEMRAERERQAAEAKRIADERAELDRQQREAEEARRREQDARDALAAAADKQVRDAAPLMLDALRQWKNAEATGDLDELENARHARNEAIDAATLVDAELSP